MNIEIILEEHINKCGDEYLGQRDVPVEISECTNKDYVIMETENRFFIVRKEDIRLLAKIC